MAEGTESRRRLSGRGGHAFPLFGPDAADRPPADETSLPDDSLAAPDEGADADGNVARHGELARRARDVLAAAGTPLASADLAREVFGVAALQSGTLLPWTTLLDQLLKPSTAFARDGEGRWLLAAWEATLRPLSDVEFVVVDVETTGLAPGRHRLIEVGAVIIRDGDPVASFSQLINPGRHIPQFITRFTGISEKMVARRPPASEVLPRLREFIGERPIVGHNVGFDLGFLNFETEHAGLAQPFPVDGIDTIGLARRFIPGLRRAGLDRVATALHLPVTTRHRALADARLTGQVFALLLARAREGGCETLDDLRRAIAGIAPARASQPQPRPTGSIYLNPAWRRTFPDRPGVYLMKDAEGVVIYVGKAKVLRERLASYYNQPLGYTRKMDGLLQQVREIETRVLGSELEALLVESRLIKQLQPRYNVQLRNYELYPFIKVDVQHPYPRFFATREVSADGARYFGPFRSGRIVQTTIELMQKVFPLRTCTRSLPPSAAPSEPCLRYHVKRCPAPCRGELDAPAAEEYRQAIADACAFLGGERADLIDRLKRQMFEAAARQDFERAARLRDALRDADQVLLGQRLVTGAVEANNLLIVYPSAAAEQVEVFLVRHGRLVQQERTPVAAEHLRATVRRLVVSAATLGGAPSRVGREEVDQINIIARWIHRHSEDDARAFFALPASIDDQEAVERFVEGVVEAVTAPTPPPGDGAEEVAGGELTPVDDATLYED